jgi:outer membrane lipoprotein-sorting protein
MKRFCGLLIAAALTVSASTPGPAGTANGELDRVLANMQQAASKIKTIYARLNQEKRNMQIGGKEVYRGEVFFGHFGKNNDKVRINYEIPRGQILVVSGDQITVYQDAIKQCIVTTRKAAGARNEELAFFSNPYSLTSAQLKARYNITLVGDQQVDGSAAAVLELTPKTQSSVRRIKWWVDRTSWLPVKSEVVEQTGDLSTFTLSNLRLNGKLDGGLFSFRCPAGSKVVKP